ncbi:efflux pump [Xylogone sp. PMI_703]|nr:efflux pump [Xylogone sp. PMI_703]
MEKESPINSKPVRPGTVDTADTTMDKQLKPDASDNGSTAMTLDGTPPTAEPIDEDDYISGYKLIALMVSLSMCCFLLLLDTSIIVTAIPRITSDFHSLRDVGWYGSAYLLATCTLQPLTGKLYNQYNSKYMFASFLGIFELGSLLCGVATSSKMLIIGRAVAGIGGSGMVNGSLTIISSALPLQKRALYFGLIMGVSQLGVVFGPLIGGALTQYTTWRWCFYINLPLGGAMAAVLLLIRVPDHAAKYSLKGSRAEIFKSFDLLGFLLFAPAAVQVLLAVQWGGVTYPWDSAKIIGLFCGAGGVFLVYVAWEYHQGDSAMIPFSMLSNRIVWTACASMFFFFSSMLTFSYYLPIYFQAVKGVKPTLSGVYMLPGIVSQIVFGVASGFLVNRTGYYMPWVILSGIMQSISAGLISTFTPHTPTAKWVGYQIIGGCGRGIGLQMPMVAVQNVLPQKYVSISMSLLVFFQNLGGALFLSFDQTAFSNALDPALHKFAPNVDPQIVITAGATGFRAVVPESALPGILKAYCLAISHAFYIAASTAAAFLLVGLGMGFKNIKKEKANKTAKEKGEDPTPESIATSA